MQRYTTWFRPRSVTAAAVLLYLYGGFFLAVAAATVAAFIVAGLVVAALAVFLTVLGSRVIRGEPWAQSVTLIMAALGTAGAGFVVWYSSNTTMRVVSGVVALGLMAIASLLSVPPSRQYFRSGEETTP